MARRLLRDLGTLLLAALLALLIRATLFETYYVPSESMLPTLLVGDHMFVGKLAFGVRLPFTGRRLPGGREPARGEVVVFRLGRRGAGELCPVDRCPRAPREGFVKRIVGLPGDVVEVRRGAVYLNDELLPAEDTGEEFVDGSGVPLRVRIERLGEVSHPVLDHPFDTGLDQVRITVPPERYFLLGDNRDDSNDSRAWGTVHRDDLVGSVSRIYWSWNNRESWAAMANPLTWWRLLSQETRFGRIGHRVE